MMSNEKNKRMIDPQESQKEQALQNEMDLVLPNLRTGLGKPSKRRFGTWISIILFFFFLGVFFTLGGVIFPNSTPPNDHEQSVVQR